MVSEGGQATLPSLKVCAELIESVPDTRFHIAQYGMIKCAYDKHMLCIALSKRSSREVGLARLPDAGNLTPKLTPTLMNSDDKDE
jgi:hypothetical protein